MSNLAKDVPEFEKIKTQGLKTFLDSSDSSLHAIPNFYIAPLAHRPIQSLIDPSKTPLLPVIDLADLHSSRRAQVVEAIGHACETWGFFQIVNHGVPSSVLQGMMSAVKQFFDLPFEEKKPFYSTDVSKPARCGTSFNPDRESFLQWKDYLRHTLFPAQVNMWPDNPACYRENAAQYSEDLVKLSSDLLVAISESLNLQSDYLANVLGQFHLGLNLNYYPACPNPELTIGSKSHTDVGVLTLLLQDEVGGLQVKHEDVWVPVQPIPDAFVVNLADQLQILSNGKYKSIEHRAVSTQVPRISIATFVQPLPDSKIGPIPSLLNGILPMYKEVVFKEYMRTFIRGDLERPHIGTYKVDQMSLEQLA